MLNKVIVIGNLEGDPEITETQKGTPFAKFVVINREVRADGQGAFENYITCTVWGQKQLDWVRVDRFYRGNLACIEGKLKARRRVTKAGTFTDYEVVVERMDAIGDEREAPAQAEEAQF